MGQSNQLDGGTNMKKLLIAAGITAAVTFPAMGSASAEKPTCNWGQLTASSIADGFAQGEHASSFAGEARVGLPNIFAKGDLNATCEALS